MQLGYFTMPSHPPERSLKAGHEWDLQVIRWLDELGYSECWIGEHHTAPWEPHPSPDLLVAQGVDLQGFELGKAYKASFDGLTIVGSGLPAGSRTFQPWIARLDPGTFVPESSCISLVAASIVAFVCIALHRSRQS